MQTINELEELADDIGYRGTPHETQLRNVLYTLLDNVAFDDGYIQAGQELRDAEVFEDLPEYWEAGCATQEVRFTYEQEVSKDFRDGYAEGMQEYLIGLAWSEAWAS